MGSGVPLGGTGCDLKAPYIPPRRQMKVRGPETPADPIPPPPAARHGRVARVSQTM